MRKKIYNFIKNYKYINIFFQKKILNIIKIKKFLKLNVKLPF